MFAIPIAGVTSGLILMWSGSIASIPAGWVLCDGNNSTPDLRDQFVVAAKQDDSGTAKTNISGSLTQSGGSLGHLHATGTLAVGNCDATALACEDVPDFNVAHGNHSHPLTGSSANTNHLTPYYALAFIMKT